MELGPKMSTTKAFSPGALKFYKNNHRVTKVMKCSVDLF